MSTVTRATDLDRHLAGEVVNASNFASQFQLFVQLGLWGEDRIREAVARDPDADKVVAKQLHDRGRDRHFITDAYIPRHLWILARCQGQSRAS